MGLVLLPTCAHMSHTFHDALTFDASSPLTPRAPDNSVRHNEWIIPAQKMPTHINSAPTRIFASVVMISGAEVEHLAISTLRDDGADVIIGGVDATAAVHTEKTGVITGVDRAGPVLVDAGGAVAVLTAGAAAKGGEGDSLAADVAGDVGGCWRGTRVGEDEGCEWTGASYLCDGDWWGAHSGWEGGIFILFFGGGGWYDGERRGWRWW